MPESLQSESFHRLVVLVSDNSVVRAAAARALSDLAADRPLQMASAAAEQPLSDAYGEVIARGLRFLDLAVPADSISLLAGEQPLVLDLLLVDHPDYRYSVTAPGPLNDALAELSAALGDVVEFEPGPYTVQVYTEPDVDSSYSVERFTPRWMPHEAWVVTADIACAFVDSVQQHCNRRLRPELKQSCIADAIADFLTERAGSAWGLHYYTGSGVATFIDDIEHRALANGNPIVRGPSEHSLACSALARWNLDRAPFAIVATSGMQEEFRGTVANHVAVRTKGFIVCSDSREDQWHPFQGTIHRTADSRPSLLARGFPVVYIGRSDDIAQGLADVVRKGYAGRHLRQFHGQQRSRSA